MAEPGSTTLKSDFEAKAKNHQRLADELKFALNERLETAAIKTHIVDARVKTFDSFIEKTGRKGYGDPFIEMQDLVGARVVVLFRSDLARVRELVRDLFSVFHEEDKEDGQDESSFEYMGVHFNARLGENFRGPRYHGLDDIVFEVQVRTIVMDAWAAVSHHLGYKGKPSMPPELHRDFFALSGLFYVADQHFEIFFAEAERAGVRATAAVSLAATPDGSKRKTVRPIPVNADTLRAWLIRKFPDRDEPSRADAAELADDLLKLGYHELPRVNALVARTADAFHAFEEEYPPEYDESGDELAHDERRFQTTGVLRVSMGLAHRELRGDYSDPGRYKYEEFAERFGLNDPPSES